MASRDKSGRSYGTGRTRNYATVVYQESAPADWQAVLEECFISAFISPYHDKDKNPDGEDKKPHWHVMIMFDTVKTKEQAKEIFDKIGGVGCEVINSMRGYARYLCHLDNPDKHQYDRKDVVCLSGADYETVISLPSDKYTALADMVDFIVDGNIYSYAVFLFWCHLNRPDWFKVLCDSSSAFIERFIRSRYFDRKESVSGSMNFFSQEENFVNYAPLFRLLGERKLKRSDLLDVISRKTLNKLIKGYPVDLKTINKICDFLQCQPGDVMEFEKKAEAAVEAPADPAEHPVDDFVESAGTTLREGDVEAEAVFVEPPVLPKAERQVPAVKGNRYSRRHYKKVKASGGGVRLSPP